MADQNRNPIGILGRVLTLFGIVWIGIVILDGLGLLSEIGMNRNFLAGMRGSIIPGILLVGAGRALRRRARTTEEQPGPVIVPPRSTVPGSRVPTSRSEPSAPSGPSTILTPPRLPTSVPPAPKPPVKPAPKPVAPTQRNVKPSLEDVVPPREQDATKSRMPPIELESPPLKTSQELIEEARKKWGKGKTPRPRS